MYFGFESEYERVKQEKLTYRKEVRIQLYSPTQKGTSLEFPLVETLPDGDVGRYGGKGLDIVSGPVRLHSSSTLSKVTP